MSNHSREMSRPNSSPSNGNNSQDCTDVSYIEELERQSSRLIHLLRSARPNSLEVEASNRMPQLSQHQRKVQSQTSYSHFYHVNMQNLANLRTLKDSDFYENINRFQPEHDLRMPKLSTSTITGMTTSNVSPGCVSSQSEDLLSTDRNGGGRLSRHGLHSASHDTHKTNDRLKKDTHNKIEKRRRSNINDKIAELKTLLPEYIRRTSCQKKSSILEESIDYVKQLESDLCRLKQIEDKMKEMDIQLKKIGFKIKQLELVIAPTLADSMDGSQLQDRTTTYEPTLNSRSTLPPTTGANGNLFYSPLLEYRSDIYTAPPKTLQSNEVLVDSAILISSSSEMNTDDLDRYL